MIKVEKIQTYGFEVAIRGMRNPLNSWDKSDSIIYPGRDFDDCKATVNKCPRGEDLFCIGESDLNLAGRLIACGTPDRKFLRLIYASMDITAPLYWWKEYDTYKVATVANSCSTMHEIHSTKKITLEDFSIDNIEVSDDDIDLEDMFIEDMFINVVADCERLRSLYMETKDKKYWRALIQLLPEGYNQKRTVSLNYETLRGMYYWRKNHKLSEWREFCQIMTTLPYAEEFIIN